MQLKKFLHNHNQSLLNKNLIINSVINIIKQKTNVLIEIKNCVLKDNVLYIKTKPIYKEKILSQKENLLIDLKEFNIINII